MSYDLYTSLLKMNDTFRPTDDGVKLMIDFSSPMLAELRNTFDLASIAGEGETFTRAVRLMDWLTTHVRHDGSCNPEGKRCAMTALEYAFDQPDKGINCAWLATTLTECLLSLGISARTVFIMPFAPYDSDNHVVTHVWTGAQWVMLDPTTNSYVMDAEGKLLDVFTLREKLANQQEVVFNAEMRYNGQPHDATEQRDYLAKDLFWFMVLDVSGCDCDPNTLMIAPEHYDPKRRDVLNIDYRIRQYGDAEWLHKWRKAVEDTEYVYCSIEDARKTP